MASRDLNARILISAKDEASTVLSALRDHAGKIAAAIIGYFSFHFFKGAIDDASEFEKQMSKVQAVSGATGEELKKLEQAAKEMGDKTQYTATEAAQALEELGKAGLTSSQQIDALPEVLSLAQANSLSLADAAGFVTKTVNGMGLSFSDSARVADVLTQAASSTNTSVQGLGEGLSYAAPMAKTLGLSLEQTVAYLGKMADAGIDASRAGTALNGVMTQFLDPSSKFRAELAKLGINTQDFNQAIAQLAAKGKSGEAALLALGTEAGPGMRALLNQGIPALQDLTKKLQESKGAAAAAAATMSDNLDGAVKGLDSSFDSLKLQLSQPILEPLKNAALWLTAKLQALTADGMISRVGEFIAETFNRGAVAFEAFVAKIDFTAVGTAVNTFGAMFQLVFNAGVEKAGRLIDAITNVYTILNNNGVFTVFQGIAVQAVALVVDSIKALSEIVFQAFKTVAESQAFNQFATAAIGAIDALKNAAGTLSQPFIDLFATLTGGQVTTTSFGETFGEVLSKLTQLATVFVNGFSTGLDVLAVAFHGIAGVNASFVSSVLEGISKIQSGYAAITFGELSKRHQAAADEMHKIAESFAASAKENYGKAEAAMDRVGQSAEVTNKSLNILAGTGLPAATGQANQTAGALNDTANAANAAKNAGDNLASGAGQWVNPHQALVDVLTRQKNELIANGASQNALQAISEKLSLAQQAAKQAAEQHAAAMASTGTSAGMASANVGALKTEVANLPKEPKKIFINAETKKATDRISQLKEPTGSTHTADASAGVAVALGQIEKLKVPTSSTHTVYVQRVEAAGNNAPPAQATGGPAGQPTGEPWRFSIGGYTPMTGKLPGYGGGDQIRALLEPGEFIVRKEAVQALGLPFMYQINAGEVPTLGNNDIITALQNPGFVGSGALQKLVQNLNMPLSALRNIQGLGGSTINDLLANPGIGGSAALAKLGLPLADWLTLRDLSAGDVIRRSTGGPVGKQPDWQLVSNNLLTIAKSTSNMYSMGADNAQGVASGSAARGNQIIWKSLMAQVNDLMARAGTPDFTDEAVSIVQSAANSGTADNYQAVQQRITDAIAQRVAADQAATTAAATAQQRKADNDAIFAAAQAKSDAYNAAVRAGANKPIPAAIPAGNLLSQLTSSTPLADISAKIKDKAATFTLPMPELPTAQVTPATAPVSPGQTMRVQFVSPVQSTSTGSFNPADATAMLQVLKEAGARTV